MNGGLGLGIQLNAQNKGGAAINQLKGQLTQLRSAAQQTGAALNGVGAASGRIRGANGRFVKSGSDAGPAPGAKQDSNGRWRDATGRFLGGGGGGGDGGGGGGGGGPGGGSWKQQLGQWAVGKAKGMWSDANSSIRNIDLRQVQQQFADVGAGMTDLGMRGVTAFKPALAASEDFSFALAQIRTVASESDFSMADLRKTTMGLADTYGGTATTQANALYETISSGVTDAREATKLMDVANRFAIGGTADLMGSIDVLTSAVNTYADSGLTAQQASDMMFTAIAAGKTTAAQLSQSLGEVAPTAHAAGVSFGELQAAIATMTVQGIKTPQAMTAMNAMLSNIMKPSEDAVKEAKRLGIEFNTTAIKTKGLAGVLGQLEGNAKVNNDTLSTLFGSIDGGKAVLTLVSNGGTKFKEVLDQMGHSAGATDAAFQVMNATGKQQMERLKGMATNALILIGTALEPMASAAARVGQTIIQWFNAVPAPVRNFITMLMLGGSAGLVLVGVMMTVGAAIAGALLAIKAIGIVMIGVMLPAFGAAALVIGAVILTVVGFKRAIETNLGGAGRMFGNFASNAKLVWAGLNDFLQYGALQESLKKQLDANGLTGIVTGIYNFVSRIRHFFTSIQTGFDGVLATMGPTFARLGAAFEGLGVALGLTSKGAAGAQKTWDKFGAAGQFVGSILGSVFQMIVSAMAALMEMGAGFIETWDEIWGALQPARDALSAVGSVIKNLAVSLGLMSPDGISGGWREFGKMVGGVVKDVAAKVSSIVEVFSGVFVAISGFVALIAGVLKGNWAMAWIGAKMVVYGLLYSVMGAATGIVDSIASVAEAALALGVGGLAKGAGDSIRGLYNGMKEKMRTGMVDSSAELGEAKKEATKGAAFDMDQARAQAKEVTAAVAPKDTSGVNLIPGIVEAFKSAPKGPQSLHLGVYIDGESIKEKTLDIRDTKVPARM